MVVVSPLICKHFMSHDSARIPSKVTVFTLNPKRLTIWNSFLQFGIIIFFSTFFFRLPQILPFFIYIPLCISFMYYTSYSLFINCLFRHFARMFGATPTALNDSKRDVAVPHIRRTTQTGVRTRGIGWLWPTNLCTRICDIPYSVEAGARVLLSNNIDLRMFSWSFQQV